MKPKERARSHRDARLTTTEKARCHDLASASRSFAKVLKPAALFLAFAATLATWAAPSAALGGDLFLNLGRGPVRIYIPSTYNPETPAPLVILLHGYGSSGAGQESYMRFAPLSEEYGFLYAHPDGTTNPSGSRFWNATDACCNFFGSNVDDSGYLLALIDAVKAQLSVDDRRVHFIGHSNGGFMSYRMACDHAETVAAIASLAGATWNDPVDCSPIAPVHVLQIHGTNDSVIRYDGGTLGSNPYPGAIESVEQWASFDGCSLIPQTDLPPLDLDSSIPGAESTVRRYADACDLGGSGELWTIVGGSHTPNLSPSFSRLVVEYLLDHPKLEPSSLPDPGSNLDVVSMRAWPTPFSESCSIEVEFHAESVEHARVGRVVINDATGRRVAFPGTRALGDGATWNLRAVHWDGRLENGEPAPAGIYFATFIAGDIVRSTRLIRVR